METFEMVDLLPALECSDMATCIAMTFSNYQENLIRHSLTKPLLDSASKQKSALMVFTNISITI